MNKILEKIKVAYRRYDTNRVHFKRSVNRSAGGDVGIYIMLALVATVMVLPMIYAICQSLKPLDEIFVFPPKFFVINPSFENFRELFRTMSESWVPFSRYVFNTILISVVGTMGNVLLSSYAAYAIAKIKFPGRETLFGIVRMSLMFNATVTGISNFLIMSALGWVDTYMAGNQR